MNPLDYKHLSAKEVNEALGKRQPSSLERLLAKLDLEQARKDGYWKRFLRGS